MKNSFSLLLALFLVPVVLADIQDPPSNDYGPTRKLGRGLSNFFLAPAEIPVTIAKINEDEGNSAAFGYGVVRGLGRSATRHIAGFLEIVLWPVPAWKQSYYPLCRATFRGFTPVIRNFRLNSATNRSIRTCATTDWLSRSD
jgi:putative exosortase-associated protein (TIGR04073 family)